MPSSVDSQAPTSASLRGRATPIEPPRVPRTPGRRGRALKRWTVRAHRWTALVLGLLLLAVTTSGAVVLYEPELNRWLHPNAYASSGDRGEQDVALTEVPRIVRAHDPKFALEFVADAREVYVAQDTTAGRVITVDPATGTVLGAYETADRVNAAGWLMSLAHNVHLCGLTCQDQVGHQAWLAAEVPGSQWLGFEGERVAWGGLLLGVAAVLLLFLATSGVWLWWPGVKRWAHGVRVRWRKGRYARDYDLHQVAGMIAVPFLLLWAVTGSGYEFGFVGRAWYAALPGEAASETFASQEPTDAKTADITPAAAVAAARREVGNNAAPAGFDLPDPDDPTAYYTVWFADGFDPYGKAEYPGDLGVGVDRRTGAAQVTSGGPGRPVTAQLWEEWNFPTHTGYVVGPWWRIAWAVFGAVPLLLAFTGVSTWWYRRRTRSRRRALAPG